jgi:uncharacterized integral membrane protein
MVLFLILLILVGIGVGYYATQNTNTHDFTFYTYKFSGVQDWVPVAIAAAVVAALFLLYMIYASIRIAAQRGRIRALRQEVVALRESPGRAEPAGAGGRDYREGGARDRRDYRDDRPAREEGMSERGGVHEERHAEEHGREDMPTRPEDA